MSEIGLFGEVHGVGGSLVLLAFSTAQVSCLAMFLFDDDFSPRRENLVVKKMASD